MLARTPLTRGGDFSRKPSPGLVPLSHMCTPWSPLHGGWWKALCLIREPDNDSDAPGSVHHRDIHASCGLPRRRGDLFSQLFVGPSRIGHVRCARSRDASRRLRHPRLRLFRARRIRRRDHHLRPAHRGLPLRLRLAGRPGVHTPNLRRPRVRRHRRPACPPVRRADLRACLAGPRPAVLRLEPRVLRRAALRAGTPRHHHHPQRLRVCAPPLHDQQGHPR